MTISNWKARVCACSLLLVEVYCSLMKSQVKYISQAKSSLFSSQVKSILKLSQVYSQAKSSLSQAKSSLSLKLSQVYLMLSQAIVCHQEVKVRLISTSRNPMFILYL